MKAACSPEAAAAISRALISASARFAPSRSWNSSLDQTLHRLGCRGSLTPSLVARVIDPFLIHHHWLALGFFNWAVQQPNFTPTSEAYQSLLKSLSVSRQFGAVSSLLKQVKARKVDLEPSVYRSVIASQIIGRQVRSAFGIFVELCGLNLVEKLGDRTCNSLMAALASDGQVDCALKVFDEMCVRSVRFRTLGFGVLIWRYSAKAEMHHILDLLDRVRSSGKSDINGSIIASLIVQGLCRASKLPDAFSILEELRARDCKPDFMAYREVVEAFRAVNDVVEVMKVNKMKRKLGVAPRSSDYNEFIFELISERKLLEAKDLGEMIVKGNFPISNEALNALIGSVAAIDPASAILFFNFLIANKTLPTLLTVTNLSNNLCKHGKTDELLEVFEVLKTHHFFESTESYNVMVLYMCKAGKVREAYGVLQEMKREGLGPELETYNIIMDACCREDMIRPAKKLWDEMFASGFCGDLKTYNILINKFSEIGEIEEAQQLFNHMSLRNVAPDITTYSALLTGLCQLKNIDMAIDIFRKSVEQDMLIAETILRTFIQGLCKEGFLLAASKFLLSLKDSLNNWDSHVTLLRYLADAGEVPLAIKHIKGIREFSPAMLKPISSELSGSLSSAPNPNPIIHLVQVIQEACPASAGRNMVFL
uniref:Pentatricopeptide repeat-containing protein n=1 Tax=Kalanchoe fedtschenkoi TaxID=63787 RepID=A0A7N0ZZA6_KALFE